MTLVEGACTDVVSPPTRGWTCVVCGKACRTSGVSPPTRGWTAGVPTGRDPDLGFPAHAGMDPSQDVRSWPGPTDRVSPPTRGWTFAIVPHKPIHLGFPAHAGMDRFHADPPPASARFPRPRGDGPCEHKHRFDSAGVSPPTRGWTPNSGSAAASPRGFPAHAGMDRRRSAGQAYRNGFPRPRGDGPNYAIFARIVSMVSPPTRGWTRHGARRSDNSEGFPAHAGMDR